MTRRLPSSRLQTMWPTCGLETMTTCVCGFEVAMEVKDKDECLMIDEGDGFFATYGTVSGNLLVCDFIEGAVRFLCLQVPHKFAVTDTTTGDIICIQYHICFS